MPHVAAALDSVGVATARKGGVLEITAGLKWDIVEAPRPATAVRTSVRRAARGSRRGEGGAAADRSVPPPVAPTGETAALSDIFAALADPIRRAIIVHLTGGPCSVTWLGAPFAVSAPAISKHLAVLERCGLIVRWKSRPGALLPAGCRPVGAGRRLDRAASGLLGAPARCARRLSGQGAGHMQSATAETARIGIELQRTLPGIAGTGVPRLDAAGRTARMVVSAGLGRRRDRDRSAHRRHLSHRDVPRRQHGRGVSVSGQFLEVRPPERLVYTWRWEGAFAEMPETLVTLELRGIRR